MCRRFFRRMPACPGLRERQGERDGHSKDKGQHAFTCRPLPLLVRLAGIESTPTLVCSSQVSCKLLILLTPDWYCQSLRAYVANCPIQHESLQVLAKSFALSGASATLVASRVCLRRQACAGRLGGSDAPLSRHKFASNLQRPSAMNGRPPSSESPRKAGTHPNANNGLEGPNFASYHLANLLYQCSSAG